jgi:hypothetical protein
MHDEGYLLLATGPARYVEMARNLAASIRHHDKNRPICLVHDENAALDHRDAWFFDHYSVLRNDPLYPGFMNKIRLFPTSPYGRAMFVDADCLMVKGDIETYWQSSRQQAFAITGRRRTQGEWKGADVAQLLRQEQAPYLVQMNSGVFTFDRSEAASRFFAGLNDFYLRRKDFLGIGLHRGKPAQTDEIYIGLWMGLNGLDSCTGEAGMNRWMNSTWRAFGITLDLGRGVSLLRKPVRSTFGIPNPLLGWEQLSPTLMHFVGLKPANLYKRAAQHFRAMAPA